MGHLHRQRQTVGVARRIPFVQPTITVEVAQVQRRYVTTKDLLFRINDGGTCVIFSTHDHEIVKTFGQRVMVFRDGLLASDEERRVPDRDRAPRLTDHMYQPQTGPLPPAGGHEEGGHA